MMFLMATYVKRSMVVSKVGGLKDLVIVGNLLAL